jgi:hypothetical protein
MAYRQDGVIVNGVPLFGRDVANAAVTMIDVISVHEAGGPGSRGNKVGEAFARELGRTLMMHTHGIRAKGKKRFKATTNRTTICRSRRTCSGASSA